MKTKFYAAYGSNINIQQMSGRCPEATICNNGVYQWLQADVQKRRLLPISKNPKIAVFLHGLWKITERCERNLDRYEGYQVL